METCATIYENAIRAFIVIGARGFFARRVLLLFCRFSKKFGFSHDKKFRICFFLREFSPLKNSSNFCARFVGAKSS